jgi:hypothetical protein
MESGQTRKWWSRHWLSASVSVVLLLSVVGFGVASANPEEGPAIPVRPHESACIGVLNPGSLPAGVDPLAEGGLMALTVPEELVTRFPVSSVTCVGRTTPEGAYIRGVFVELADEEGTAAVFTTLSESDASQDVMWREYLRETFFDSRLEFQASSPGSLFAVLVDHSDATAATSAFGAGGEEVSLWGRVQDIDQRR